MREYGRLVWSLCMRMAPTREDAADASQEIFLDLWSSASRFDPAKGREATFVSTIARRRLIDLRRGRWRSRGGGVLEEDVPAPPEADLLELREEVDLAREAIDELDEQPRRVLSLSLCSGWSGSRISEHLQLPLGTVKSHLRRGLLKVRARLEEMRHGGSIEPRAA